MASWPLDLARGVRQALGDPGVDAIRDLLAAILAPDEVGALFTIAESDVCLVAASPRAEPFDIAAVRRLASEACRGTEVRQAAPSPEWPAALAFPVGEGEAVRVLVVLARTPAVSAATRARAALLAPILGLVADLDATRRRARLAEAQVAEFRQMVRLAKPGRDLQEISQDVLDLAVRLIDAGVGALWLRGRPGADLDLRAARRGLARRGPRPSLAAGDVEPLLGAAPLACPPYPLVLPRELLRDESVEAAVLIPLHQDDELVGLLAVGRHEPGRPFGPGDAERLSELAELAAVPVVNVCLRDELGERSRQGRATRRIAKAIAASLSLEELFRVATREIRRLTAFDAAALVLLDDDGEGGRVVVGEPDATPRILAWTPELWETLPGSAIRGRRAAISDDLAAGARSVGPLVRELPDARAAMVVPLLADGESIGALLLLSRTRGRFGAADLRRLRPAAELLAVAARQVRLSRSVSAGREERLRLETRLRRAERHATIGRLTGALAHEIRNPLTVIGTTVQYLRDRLAADHEHRALLDAADRKVREMDESLEGLLNLSRPLDLRPRAVDVAALLAALAGVVAARAGRQSVEVTVTAAPDLPAAMLDARLVEQALLSLVQNALDAMPDGGRLALAAGVAPESGNLVLTVSDTGPGIQDADLGGIFEPSYTTKRRGGGLGLALARRIVEEHGGAIEATSEPGRGTTFVVVLPPGGAAREPADG
jgi:signal transduction histidine kinase